MASAEVTTTITITMSATVVEIDELVEQLSWLVDDNRSTEVTRLLLRALNGAGY